MIRSFQLAIISIQGRKLSIVVLNERHGQRLHWAEACGLKGFFSHTVPHTHTDSCTLQSVCTKAEFVAHNAAFLPYLKSF